MTLFNKLIYRAIIASSLFFQATLFAETKTVIEIPKVDDAQVFASFNDKYPAVLNYFSALDKDSIIAFYQAQFGDILSQELKRKRLTLIFNHEDKEVRVVISTQNKKRQVDVIVEADITKQ